MAVIWVSRPAEHAGELTAALTRRGLQPLLIPAMEIVPAPAAPLNKYLAAIETFDLSIFVSRAAAAAVAAKMPTDGNPLLALAIGAATAAALPPRYILQAAPANIGDSAALLASPALAAPPRRIAVLGGTDASGAAISPALVDGLRARGSEVVVVPCYLRQPAPPNEQLNAAGQSGGIDASVAYSGSAAAAMLAMTAPDNAWLLRLPLFVIHANIAAAAKQRGFQNIITATDIAAAAAAHFS